MKLSSVLQSLRLEVPLVDLKAQWSTLAPEIRPAIDSVLEHANFILSEDVEKFEQEFAAYLGSRYCIGVASGADAIMLALEACGIGSGDEVLVPANTYVATVSAICHRGARPVFVDIDERTFLMDFKDAKAKATPRTRAIIPVYLYGRAMDMGPLLGWAANRQCRIIEDACQAHGSRINGVMAGCWGEVGCFSFYPGKNLGCYGDGGAVVTNNPDIAKCISILRNQGQEGKYIHTRKGYNSRLDSLQSAVLRVKLRYLDRWNDQRRRWATHYEQGLSDIPELTLPSWDKSKPQGHVFHLYVIRTSRRDELLRHLRDNGVGAQMHYPIPVHLQEGYRDLGFCKGDLPVCERVAAEILSLPMYPELTQEKADYVVNRIKEFFRS